MSALGMGAAASAINLGLGVAGHAITGLIDNAWYKRNLNLQVGAQKDLIDYQNEYNDPSHQMQRLMSAGLNPNLVYGSNAPAGLSGNASAPSGSGFAGKFNTQDVAAAALHFKQMETQDSVINSNNAAAAASNATAKYYNTLSNRYDEVTDTNIKEANARIEEIASRVSLNASEEEKNIAQKIQLEADAAYKAAQIDLFQYEKQNLVAQTVLYGAQAHKARAEAHEANQRANYYRDASGLVRQQRLTEVENTAYVAQMAQREYYEAAISEIQFRWDEIVKNKGNAKEAQLAMRAELRATAHKLGIEGKDAVIWTDKVMSWLSGSTGAASNAGSAAAGISIATKGKGAAAAARVAPVVVP